MLARRAGDATQPDAEMRAVLRAAYSRDAVQIIDAAGVVGTFFQTVAAANGYRGAADAHRTPWSRR